MAIFLEHAFHYLCTVLRGEWRARPLNVIYSAGFSYITTCNLQTTIESIYSVIIPNSHKVYSSQKCHFFVQRGLTKIWRVSFVQSLKRIYAWK